MSKNFSRVFISVLIAIFISGCANVTMRAYKKQEERVDQELQGNAGYLAGTPQQPDRSQIKKTRANYILEVEKIIPEPREGVMPPKEEGSKLPEESPSSVEEEASSQETMPYGRSNIEPTQEPSAGMEAPAPVGPTASGFTEYTIEKNDTLQKISKKFYNSYSKWSKIYEVNKDIIKDPNKLRPGVVIKIPQL